MLPYEDDEYADDGFMPFVEGTHPPTLSTHPITPQQHIFAPHPTTSHQPSHHTILPTHPINITSSHPTPLPLVNPFITSSYYKNSPHQHHPSTSYRSSKVILIQKTF